jgi:hypothetical protein
MWKDVPTENMPFAARARNERARSNRHCAKPSNGRRNSVRRRRRWSSASARQMSATRTSGGRPDATSGLQTNEGGRHAGRLPSLILAGDLRRYQADFRSSILRGRCSLSTRSMPRPAIKTSSALLVFSPALLTIPYERMKASHFLHDRERTPGLADEIRRLQKVEFLSAPFWKGKVPGEWRQSRIMASVENVNAWKDEKGRRSVTAEANTINRRSADDVIRVLRNGSRQYHLPRRRLSGNRRKPDGAHGLSLALRRE